MKLEAISNMKCKLIEELMCLETEFTAMKSSNDHSSQQSADITDKMKQLKAHLMEVEENTHVIQEEIMEIEARIK